MRRVKLDPRGMIEVAQVIDGAMKKLGVKGDWEQYKVEIKCREWMGSEVGKHLTHVKFAKNVITLLFDHSAFLNEMNYQKEEFIGRLKTEFPRMAIKDLRAALSKENKKNH